MIQKCYAAYLIEMSNPTDIQIFRVELLGLAIQAPGDVDTEMQESV